MKYDAKLQDSCYAPFQKPKWRCYFFLGSKKSEIVSKLWDLFKNRRDIVIYNESPWLS